MHLSEEPYFYGVAVAVNALFCIEYFWDTLTDEEKEHYCEIVEDTTLAHCEEFIRAYEMSKDTINILREGLCNISTPPSYYLELPDEVAPHWMQEYAWRLHFYEVYFDEPLWVTDSFYVGMSQYLPKRNSTADKWPVWSMIPLSSEVPHEDQDNLHYPFNILFSPDSNCDQWSYADDLIANTNIVYTTDIFNNYTQKELWFFPIVDSGSWDHPHSEGIAPQPYAPAVEVYPNPTTDRVSIRSEHTISYIEIYNSQGQLVDIHNTRDTSCELDFTTLPSGVYFLHLYTSGGTFSRRVMKFEN